MIGFRASVTNLIPLYAIGVFLSFTLSQTGMARRWWKSGQLKEGEKIVERGSTIRFDKGWVHKMIINGIGAFSTAIVAVIFAVTKFKDGAWVIIILIPLLVAIFTQIHHHYKHLAASLSLEHNPVKRKIGRNRVIMPISGVHKGTLAGLQFASSISDDITGVHVSIDPVETETVKTKWETWGEDVRMVMLDSPYRLFIEPILGYISEIAEVRQPGETITIVVPEFVSENRLSAALHTNTANILREQLKNQHGIVITNVPYHVHDIGVE